MQKLFCLALYGWIAALLVACASSGHAPEQDAALQRQFEAAKRALDSSSAPHVIYAGFAMHSQSKAFASDVRLGAQFARTLDPEAIIIELDNPAVFQGQGLPLATRENIEYTLKRLGQITRDQDKVLLLFSSHGAAGQLAINASNHTDKPLAASDLQQWTQSLRGKPTVMLLSACYSGSLIEPLGDAHRIIYTAAARNRNSFGCNFQSEGTFFIDALLRAPHGDDMSWTQLMARARTDITRREAALGVKLPSMPQAFVGDDMRALANMPIREFRSATAARLP